MTTRWGVLGAGWIVNTAMARAIHSADGAILHATASRDLARAEATEPRRAYADYQGVLDDPEVDVVYIALSNDAHVPWILASLAAGKHVLCEKPLATCHANAVIAFEAARKANLLLIEAAWSRWHPRMQRLSELVRSGAIGSVEHYSAGFTFTGELEGNYRLDRAAGGGALLDVGVYPLHGLVSIVDLPDYVAVEDLRHERHTTGVDLSTDARISWAPSTSASIEASFVRPENQYLSVAGTDGVIRLDGEQAFTSWKAPSALQIDNHVERFAPVDAYRIMVEQVSARVQGDEAWILPRDDSLAVARLVDLLK